MDEAIPPRTKVAQAFLSVCLVHKSVETKTCINLCETVGFRRGSTAVVPNQKVRSPRAQTSLVGHPVMGMLVLEPLLRRVRSDK